MTTTPAAPEAARSAADAVDRAGAWLRAHPWVVDATIATVVLLVSLWLVRSPVIYAPTVLGCLVLVARRARPLAVAIVVTVTSAIGVLLTNSSVPVAVAALVTVYSVTAYGPRWAGPVAVLTTVAGGGLQIAMNAVRVGPPTLGLVVTVLAIAAVLAVTTGLGGSLRRAGLRRVEYLRERAQLLESEQVQQARLATLAERARISREMHDIIAHSLSVMIVQADGGRIGATRDPEMAASMFGDIATTGRGALADIRTLLGLLREGDTAGGEQPQPGIDAIPELVEEWSRAGTPVSLSNTGEPRRLPAGMELTVYRAVQEALTNTVKHAGPGTAVAVELAWHRDHLALHVTDDGPVSGAVSPAAGTLGGHGLVGMRERVAAHGGTVDAATRPGRGFGVHLHLPYPDQAWSAPRTGPAGRR